MTWHRSLFLALNLLAIPAAVLAQPAPALNPDPTDTNNPRLVGKAFPFNNLPEQADTSSSIRGTQTGYNRCNSTTEGPNSQCQTAIINSLADFCIFAPPKPGSTIGDTEEEEVTWCSQPGHGGRLIPPGALTGVQFITTPSYVEVTGHVNQTMINMQASDGGGELDSGGQDNRGNPIGGLVYSNTIPGSNGQYTQSRVWHMFLGNDIFCFKACSNTDPNALGLCQHIFDTVGCNTNVPASYVDGVFLQCLGEDQDPVAPGDMRIPASSDCTTFTSSLIYPQPTTTTTSTSTSATGTGAAGAGATGGAGGSGSSGSSGSGSSSSPSSAVSSKSGQWIVAVLVPAAALLVGGAFLA